MDEKPNERPSLVKTVVDSDKGALVKRTEVRSGLSVSRSEKSCSTDVNSECGSSSNDPMKLWEAMKQNGFLSNPHGGVSASSSHGGIPAPPRKRCRRSKSNDATDMVKKRKVEVARKEEAERFARLAAPSGLLNELNPGIINHVRNKRQVLSIIQSIVKSDKDSTRHRKKNLEDSYSMRYREEKCVDGEFSEDNDTTAGKYSENASSLSSEEAAGLNHASVLTVKGMMLLSLFYSMCLVVYYRRWLIDRSSSLTCSGYSSVSMVGTASSGHQMPCFR